MRHSEGATWSYGYNASLHDFRYCCLEVRERNDKGTERGEGSE